MTDNLWLAKAILDSDLKPRSYSGRFMYGKQCLGFETDESSVKAIGLILVSLCRGASAVRAKEDVMDLAEILQDAREDSLGLGTIVYFPNVPWHDSYETGEEEEEGDEDECLGINCDKCDGEGCTEEDEIDCDDSDDGQALASAGMGTDEDYGGTDERD